MDNNKSGTGEAVKSFARLFKGGGFLRRSLKPLTAVSGMPCRLKAQESLKTLAGGAGAKHLQESGFAAACGAGVFLLYPHFS